MMEGELSERVGVSMSFQSSFNAHNVVETAPSTHNLSSTDHVPRPLWSSLTAIAQPKSLSGAPPEQARQSSGNEARGSNFLRRTLPDLTDILA